MARIMKGVPEEVCGLTDKEQSYIAHSLFEIPYDLDIIGHSVLVPPEEMEKAKENLMIDHLKRLFGFSIKETPGAEVHELKELKIRKVKSAPKPKEPERVQPVIKPGLVFLDTRKDVKQKIIKPVSGGSKWEIMLIGIMQPNYVMASESFLIAVQNGIFKLLYNETSS